MSFKKNRARTHKRFHFDAGPRSQGKVNCINVKTGPYFLGHPDVYQVMQQHDWPVQSPMEPQTELSAAMDRQLDSELTTAGQHCKLFADMLNATKPGEATDYDRELLEVRCLACLEKNSNILPRDAMYKRGLCRRVVSVRPSVSHICVFCRNA